MALREEYIKIKSASNLLLLLKGIVLVNVSGREHRFGGDWTTEKLDILEGYLKAYTIALSKQIAFKKIYIDAFAGTGYRKSCSSDSSAGPMPLFPDLAEEEPQRLLDGSARIALRTIPEFDYYAFIDNSAEKCYHLENLKEEFPILKDRILIKRGEANNLIQEICKRDWSTLRAVLFLDPYGMQVEWKTIEAIANTKAIDLWILFPLGIGVNRLLKKDGDIPEPWRNRLNIILGTEEWYDEFYSVTKTPTLFGENELVVKASIDSIGKYFVRRLHTIFPCVAENPRVLKNSVNNPLYLLCFAAGNERGASIALKIAKHLLKDQ